MRSINVQLVALISALALSSLAAAETGTGYSINVKGEPKTMADGSAVQETTADDIWLITNQPEGFASEMVASCSGVWVMRADYSNMGSTFRCVARDADGDGYVSVGNIPGADWSGCVISMSGGWGKYTSAKGNATCQVSGPFAGADTGAYTWARKWDLPK